MEELNREAGILLHPVSLPSEDGIGDFGKYAFEFIDFLADAEIGIWQVLPLGPTAYGNSPYTAVSSFAGNPLFISLDLLRQDGLLQAEELNGRPAFSPDRTDYTAVYEWKNPMLRKAAVRFLDEAEPKSREAYEQFCRSEELWLEDYTLFVTAKNYFDRKASEKGIKDSRWNYYWPQKLARRDPEELQRRREEWQQDIAVEKVLQFFFRRQWQKVKEYAHERGVRLFGDIPIFVSPDSADVWANPELFILDAHSRPSVVAGVPPDYFSSTGQRWGNPLYRWEEHRRNGFSWWVSRIRKTLEQVDMVRIDHFRGFEAYWEIPVQEPTAVKGRWVKAPGRELFKRVAQELGELPIVAEDLGVITPEVDALRREFGFPGMKVLQFAFEPDGDGGIKADNPFLPHNHQRNYVAYTGTHDNDTSRGWFESQSAELRELIRRYAGSSGQEIVWDLMRSIFMSSARIAIVPFQDPLVLPAEARMNTPGTVGGNWSWRVRAEAFNGGMSGRLRDYCRLYGRVSRG
ncbi:MAG: 4-alpha-glucanotransferase [Spirochaetia bacterium]